MSTTIIIPVFNEEKVLDNCLAAITMLSPVPQEIIVVDGGSTDRTLEVAQNYPCKVIQSKVKGRAHQQDVAARQARGDHLIFLHADTIPHPQMIHLVERCLANQEVVLGGFRSIMKGEKVRRLISWHNFIKTYYAPFIYNPYRTSFKGLRLLFGDQVMFCRKQDYLKSGGFDLEEEVMEEAAFCLRMNQLGRIVQLNHKVYSSDRRVVKWGVLRAHFLYILICTAWGWGVSSKKLAKLYPDVR